MDPRVYNTRNWNLSWFLHKGLMWNACVWSTESGLHTRINQVLAAAPYWWQHRNVHKSVTKVLLSVSLQSHGPLRLGPSIQPSMVTCTLVCWTMTWYNFTNRKLTDEERTWLEDKACRLPLPLIYQVFFSFEPRFLREIDITMSSKSPRDTFGYGWPLFAACWIPARFSSPAKLMQAVPLYVQEWSWKY